jgi:2-oxoglutarate ferredoxin oxidoreductase subunit gamma
MKKALPGLVPGRFLELNKIAFDKGYEYGKKIMTEEKKPKKR